MLRFVLLATFCAVALAAHGGIRTKVVKRGDSVFKYQSDFKNGNKISASLKRVRDDTCDVQGVADLLAKMTIDELLAPCRDKLCLDSDVKGVVTYLSSDTFKTREQVLLAEPEVEDLMGLVIASSCDLQKFIDFLGELLACPSTVYRNRLQDNADDLAKLLADCTLEDMVDPFHTRLLTETDIMCLLNIVNQGQGLDDLNTLLDSDIWATIKGDLTDLKVDVARGLKLLSQLSGIPLR